MKVMQVINNMATGGAEKLLLETIPLYIERGIEMDLLVLNGHEYPFMEKLKSLGICKVHSLDLNSVYNPLAVFKLIPYLKKYDIVHIHLFPAQYWVVLAKMLSFSKTKLVFTEHSTSNRRIQNKLFGIFDRFIYSYYEYTICITNQVKEVIQKHASLAEKKLIVIENGIPLNKFKNAAPLPKPDFFKADDLKLLIQVSSFQEPKDQKTVIESLQFLPGNINLLLVGEGHLKHESEKLVETLQLQNRVKFLGQRMDVPNLLKTSDITILSSKYEGLSLSSIEGMAAGKPFVAADVPGLTEMVEGAGVLFKQGDAKELSKKILELLGNKDHYNSIVESCQNRAAQYDINLMIEKHVNLYAQIYK